MAPAMKVRVLPDDHSLRGGRVAVAPGTPLGPMLLEAQGRHGPATIGVVPFVSDAVEPGFLALGESLAARLGLADSEMASLRPHEVTPIRSLELEALVEEDPDSLWHHLKHSDHLEGQCLWVQTDPDSVVVDAGRQLFRVRSLDGPQPGTLRQITPSTEVELFIPGSKVGLDMVVLADESGSMQVDDLLVQSEGWFGRTTYRTRMDALKDSLRQMLEIRLRVSGRESRIALLAFATVVSQRFPESGMVALDAASPTHVVDGFRRAIDQLNPYGSTNMNEAILRAAELLDLHGKVGNERLIVLVSDGKAWTPKGAESAGETVGAVDDPLSLVRHLFTHRKIRLQAIGISDAALFEAWCRRGHTPQDNLRPDHPLLLELVKVGGGDPSRIGGIEVLEEYFTGLGAGLRRYIGSPVAAKPRSLSEQSLKMLNQLAHGQDLGQIGQLVDGLSTDISRLNEACRVLAGRELGPWMPFVVSDRIRGIFTEIRSLRVQTKYEFENLLNRLHLVVVESGPGRRRGPDRLNGWPEALSPFYEVFVPVTKRVNAMRQVYFHDKTSGKASDQRDVDEAAQAMTHYVQARQLADTDAAGWAALSQAMLEDVAEAVRRAADLAEADARTVPPSPSVPVAEEAPPGPEDLDSGFRIRLRD